MTEHSNRSGTPGNRLSAMVRRATQAARRNERVWTAREELKSIASTGPHPYTIEQLIEEVDAWRERWVYEKWGIE